MQHDSPRTTGSLQGEPVVIAAHRVPSIIPPEVYAYWQTRYERELRESLAPDVIEALGGRLTVALDDTYIVGTTRTRADAEREYRIATELLDDPAFDLTAYLQAQRERGKMQQRITIHVTRTGGAERGPLTPPRGPNVEANIEIECDGDERLGIAPLDPDTLERYAHAGALAAHELGAVLGIEPHEIRHLVAVQGETDDNLTDAAARIVEVDVSGGEPDPSALPRMTYRVEVPGIVVFITNDKDEADEAMSYARVEAGRDDAKFDRVTPETDDLPPVHVTLGLDDFKTRVAAYDNLGPTYDELRKYVGHVGNIDLEALGVQPASALQPGALKLVQLVRTAATLIDDPGAAELPAQHSDPRVATAARYADAGKLRDALYLLTQEAVVRVNRDGSTIEHDAAVHDAQMAEWLRGPHPSAIIRAADVSEGDEVLDVRGYRVVDDTATRPEGDGACSVTLTYVEGGNRYLHADAPVRIKPRHSTARTPGRGA